MRAAELDVYDTDFSNVSASPSRHRPKLKSFGKRVLHGLTVLAYVSTLIAVADSMAYITWEGSADPTRVQDASDTSVSPSRYGPPQGAQQQQHDILLTSLAAVAVLAAGIVFTVELVVNRKRCALDAYTLIDFAAGPASLAFDIFCLVKWESFCPYSILVKILRGLTFKGSRKMISLVRIIVPRVAGLFLTVWIAFYLFAYGATLMFYGMQFPRNHNPAFFFNNLGFGSITMLQVMTLDGWGQIGRDVLEARNMSVALYFIVFVFALSYFLWNILIGLMIDISREQHTNAYKQRKPHDQREMSQMSLITERDASDESPQKGRQQCEHEIPDFTQSFAYKTLVGDYYTLFVVALYGVSAVHAYLAPDITQITESAWIGIQIATSAVYTLHSLILLRVSARSVVPSQKSMAVFHAISGPIALLADIVQVALYRYVTYGAFLQAFKMVTIKPIKKTVLGASKVVKVLVPPFCAIVALVYVWALVSYENLRWSDYWATVNGSLYTWVQILTLDNWSAGLLLFLRKDGYIQQPIIFILFVIVGNYFFLNIMISFSSQCFGEYDEDVHQQHNDLALDFYKNQVQQDAKFTLDENEQVREITELITVREEQDFLDEVDQTIYYGEQQPIVLEYGGTKVVLKSLNDIKIT